MSCYRDLNPGPLPYQGSALPLSYNSKKKKSGRRGSNPRPSAWKANALSTELLPHSCQSCHSDCGQRWIRTTEVERQQIYSLPHLATLVFALFAFEEVCFSIAVQRYNYLFKLQTKSIIFIAVIAHSSPLLPSLPPARSSACSIVLVVINP